MLCRKKKGLNRPTVWSHKPKKWWKEGLERAKEATQEIPGETEEQLPGGGVRGAIGKTIAEIAQTTKEVMVGQDEPGAEEANSTSTELGKQGEHEQDCSK